MSSRRDPSVGGSIAIYDPNGPAAIISFSAFGTVAVWYWIRFFRYKPKAKWMNCVMIGTTFMSLGYICRFSRRNGINAWSWLFETLFILLSPCLFLAQDYILLPRVAGHLEASHLLPIPRRAIIITYILADIVTVLSQLAGTALSVTFGKLVPIGHKLTMAGLWVQLAFFASFVIIYVIAAKRLLRLDQCRYSTGWRSPTPQRVIYLLGSSCVCMTIRSIYRVAEYTAGGDSDLANSEVAFYLCDTVPMFLNVVAFLCAWPPACLREKPRGSSTLEMGYR